MRGMSEYDEDKVLADYVLDHFSELATKRESIALKAAYLLSKDQTTKVAAKIREKEGYWLNSPDVQDDLADGIPALRVTVSRRILSDHADKVVIARCEKCSSILRTPKAQQCLWCGHDWH